MIIGHYEVWIMKLEILRNVIEFNFRVLANCKLVKPICTFSINLLFITFKCGIHISDIVFVLSSMRCSEFQEFGLVLLCFGFLLLFYLVDGQFALGTFFDGEKLHVAAVVSDVSLANVLLELKNAEIF